MAVLTRRFGDPDPLRRLAGEIRQHVLDHLGDYLTQFEKMALGRGWQIRWACTAEEACALIIDICRNHGVRLMVKGKSMASEEIGLNQALEAQGITPVETDLGEYIVQLDGDRPSHIVTPVIHKNRRQIAGLFARNGLGEYTEDPEALTLQARRRLRSCFQEAQAGFSGVNFAVAESGRMVVVENEGNNRLSTTTPPVHIALMGIEKLVPTDRDLAPFLKLLAASATGMDLSVYTHFLHGPRRPGELDGPEHAYLILLDNGRSDLLGGELREILRCIRCGACLNICPVYRQTSGHGYGSVYPGPMGSVLSPMMGGEATLDRFRELPKACSLCGACAQVCPVCIPLADHLVRLRRTLTQKRLSMRGTPDFHLWGGLATRPGVWRAGLRAAGWMAAPLMPLAVRFGPAKGWLANHAPPEFARGQDSFRTWWKKRQGENAE